MKVKFETESYVASHGRAPRGCGLWMFQLVGSDSRCGRVDLGWFESHGSYGEAKAAARVEAKNCESFDGEYDTVYVTVQP